jgi:2-C-methyl-D-erythritol 4-phosphate cytidylyltransferase
MNIGVIFAGGVGKRMNSRIKPKQFIDIYGKPIIIHTLDVFENNSEIDAIVIACLEDWIPYLEDLLEKFNIKKVRKIVPGGASGQESIYNGLCAAEEVANGEKSIVLIHDGVRPLIKEQTIKDNIESVKAHGSAITCVTVKETVLVVAADNSIDEVPSRDDTRLARAPQSFYLDDILAAHRRAMAEGRHDFIDSCTMLQHYGKKLYLIEGPQENIKITTPDDFYTMRALLDAKEEAQIYGFGD